MSFTGAETAAARTAHRLLERAARDGWRGPDPYDGLAFDWPRILVGGKRRRQVLMQLHARAPVDIRRLYRSEHPLIAKTLGLFGSVAVRLDGNEVLEQDIARQLGSDALARLDRDRRAGSDAWGYPWDVQTRWGFYRAGSPNIVVTAFAGVALVEAACAWEVPEWLQRARSAATWVQDALLDDRGCYVYHEGSTTLIHNANLLGARLVYQALGDTAAVLPAVERSLAGQATDGSWPYGEGERLEFVDNFHTAYVLECLCQLEELDVRIAEAVSRGAAAWLEQFFQPSGATTLWPRRRFPEDGHATGSALSALAALVERGHASRDQLERATTYALAAMTDRGHAVVRRHRLGTTKLRYIRWCDGHLALGLANASRVLATKEPTIESEGLSARGSSPLAALPIGR